MRYGFVRPEGMRARLLNALPLLYMSAILLNVQEKMSALSAFTPPPPMNICSKSCLNRVLGLPGWRRVFDAPNGHNSARYY